MRNVHISCPSASHSLHCTSSSDEFTLTPTLCHSHPYARFPSAGPPRRVLSRALTKQLRLAHARALSFVACSSKSFCCHGKGRQGTALPPAAGVVRHLLLMRRASGG